jgi:ubiquinone/menaquinone biosynthesis C-methylase UbiE
VDLSFDEIAEIYDQWYDTPAGKAIFNAEVICLKQLGGLFKGRWLEVGVGTGRFASNLGIIEGIDPSLNMRKIAAARGIRTYAGYAESLPFPDASFDGVLIAMSLCFFKAPDQALKECSRILQPAGQLLIGEVPADTYWGESYEKKKATGHPIYSLADFRSSMEILALAGQAGFSLQNMACSLFWSPDSLPETNPRVEEGIRPGAGFLCLLLKNH